MTALNGWFFIALFMHKQYSETITKVKTNRVEKGKVTYDSLRGVCYLKE
jgi:hypothetical protein